jgi:hypothetical protein
VPHAGRRADLWQRRSRINLITNILAPPHAKHGRPRAHPRRDMYSRLPRSHPRRMPVQNAIQNCWISVQIPVKYGKSRKSDAGLHYRGSLPCIRLYSHAAFTRRPPCIRPPEPKVTGSSPVGDNCLSDNSFVDAFSDQSAWSVGPWAEARFHSLTCSTSLSHPRACGTVRAVRPIEPS